MQGDLPERLAGHFEGKQHVGFARIRATIEQLTKKQDDFRNRYD